MKYIKLREELKLKLSQLPPEYRETFNLFYGRSDGTRSVEEARAMSIEDVVNEMPDSPKKLKWALKQVINTFKLRKAKIYKLLNS